MEIQIISDLHLEQIDRKVDSWQQELVEPRCNTVASLGDLCELEHAEMWHSFVSYLSTHWKTVLIVNGNHEYYSDHHTSMEDLQQRQSQWAAKYPNVYIMDDRGIIIEGVMIFGSTLWSEIPGAYESNVSEKIKDYHLIYVNRLVEVPTEQGSAPRQLTVTDVNRLHTTARLKLHEYILEHPNIPFVVLTHHAPLRNGTSAPEYELDRDRHLNTAFASDLSKLMYPNVKLWAFGHTHWHTDFVFCNTRIVSNPHGYGKTDKCNVSYKRDWVIRV
jgi:hypothetical protein